jgi:hypothetical protein
MTAAVAQVEGEAMGLFEILMGGGGQKRQEYEDFARRYEQGPPWEGYSDREVLDRYGEVAHKVSPTDYEAAVRDALARLSPAEQAQLLQELQQRTAGRGVTLPKSSPGGGGGGLDELARSVRELHEQPGRLREVVTQSAGGGAAERPAGAGAGQAGLPDIGGVFASPMAKAAIAGITAMLVRRMLAPK